MAGATRTVLVVEDEGSVRRLVAQALSAEGHKVVAAGSCAETSAHPGPFDVGIFDISLGDGCGVELAAKLLQEGTVARAIFFTGGVDAARIARAGALGTVISKGDGIGPLLEAMALCP